MDSDEFRVLVVCTGNLNRSALAAALLRSWVERYLPADAAARVVVTSAGTAAPVGRPMRRRSLAIAERFGADGVAHRAAQIDEAAIRSADLVLTADVAHRDAVLGMVPSMLRSTFTIREAGAIATGIGPAPAPATVEELRERVARFGSRRELGAGDDGDITDPQGRDDEAYRAMAREEVPPLASLAVALFGMPRAEADSVLATAADAESFSFEGLGSRSGGAAHGAGGASADGRESRRSGSWRRWFGGRET